MNTRFFEETWKHRFFFIRRRFVCELSVTDANAFSLIFSTATARLKDWYDKNPKGAVEFEVRLTATPLVLQKAQAALHELYDSGDSYEFVKKLRISLVFTHASDGKVERFDFAGS